MRLLPCQQLEQQCLWRMQTVPSRSHKPRRDRADGVYLSCWIHTDSSTKHPVLHPMQSGVLLIVRGHPMHPMSSGYFREQQSTQRLSSMSHRPSHVFQRFCDHLCPVPTWNSSVYGPEQLQSVPYREGLSRERHGSGLSIRILHDNGRVIAI
jgi:hypothetical protein